jgi:hypothetical protein
MKVGDKVVSKSYPELGVMNVLYIEPLKESVTGDQIVTVTGDHPSLPDDADMSDLAVTEPCGTCAGRDAETHIREDHNENYVNELDPCDECGADPGEKCKPECRWATCEHCGEQQDECDFGRRCNP